MADSRAYPDRPFLAVSAAIIRDGRVLVVRRARAPAQGLFTLPGGVVEVGETLAQALTREIREELDLTIEPMGLAGYREVVSRDQQGAVERHFVILAFAALWRGGEPHPSDEIAEVRWLLPAELTGLTTTEGLAEIVDAALARLDASR